MADSPCAYCGHPEAPSDAPHPCGGCGRPLLGLTFSAETTLGEIGRRMLAGGELTRMLTFTITTIVPATGDRHALLFRLDEEDKRADGRFIRIATAPEVESVPLPPVEAKDPGPCPECGGRLRARKKGSVRCRDCGMVVALG